MILFPPEQCMVLHSLDEGSRRHLQVLLELVLKIKEIVHCLLRLELRNSVIDYCLPVGPPQILIAPAPRQAWPLIASGRLLVLEVRDLAIVDDIEIQILILFLLVNYLRRYRLHIQV